MKAGLRVDDESTPKRIGRYDAFLQLGAGRIARVYLAAQRGQAEHPQLVVVKVLRPEAVADERVLAAFMDEARLATRLQHPNIARTREVVAESPDYLLAMDFHDGQSLLEVLHRLGRQAVPLDEHVYVLAKVLAGLSYAHELKDASGRPIGIVHRDVSPANVLVSYTGEVTLVDFGMAKASAALLATQDGVVAGKVGYAAPEQSLGKPADPRSDIYSVGVMLWEAIAMQRRASGETWQSVLQSRQDDAEPRLEEACPNAPPALSAIVRKALARDANDRYATAREFQRDLEKYLNGKQGPKVGAARLAAMLKPYFGRERMQRQKEIHAFLKTLREGAGPALRQMPPQRAVRPEQIAQNEGTLRVPVDCAFSSLPQHRGEMAGPDASPQSTAQALPPRQAGAAAGAPQLPLAEASKNVVTPPAVLSARKATAGPPPLPLPPKTRAGPPPLPFTSASAAASATKSAVPRATNGLGLVTLAKLDVAAPMATVSDIPPPRKALAWPALVVLGAALCIGGPVALTMHKGRAQAVAPLPIAEAPQSAPSKPRVPQVETVRVRISVDPAEAVIELDGHQLSGNPFTANIPKDNAEHELIASAKGCRSAKQRIHLNHNVDVLIALKRLWTYMPPHVKRRSAEASASASASSTWLSVAQPAAAQPPAALTSTGGARP